ncbi:MAG: OadG family transporter subunit [Pseudomonadota bacterium]
MRRNLTNKMGFWLVLAGVILAGCQLGFASESTFSTTEKPVAVITRTGDQFTAKLIPRAKSTSISIAFKTTGQGTLSDVKGVDFDTVARPEVDVKNFKSEAFEIQVTDLPPGGESTVSLTSDFFTSSTLFYVFNPTLDKPWQSDVQVMNQAGEGKIRELAITVKDGGPLDADGAADGRIKLMGGPRDSFWGYALGTLFIRFFGIFIVLTILMVGMIISGLIFNSIDRAKERKDAEAREESTLKAKALESSMNVTPQPAPDADAMEDAGADSESPAGYTSQDVSEEIVAAIALALHLHSGQGKPSAGFSATPQAASPEAPAGNAWASDGRQRIMDGRTWAFRGHNR